MGFLNQNKLQGDKKKDGDYFEASEENVVVRPGLKVPIGVWVHQIHQVEKTEANGMTTVLRRYGTEICTSTGRGGSGCRVCNTKDPMWDQLPLEKRTNKKALRVDFPKRMINVLPVKNMKTGSWQILKGGNQVYEQMSIWHDAQKDEAAKDLRRCEWSISATGKGQRRKYSTTRMDVSSYTFTDEDNQEIERLLKKAKADLAPKSADDFDKLVNGTPTDDGLSGFDFPTSIVQPSNKFDSSPPWDDSPLPVQAAPTAVATTAAPEVKQAVGTSTAKVDQTKLSEFSKWLNSQPEFQGQALVTTGLPILKELLGGNVNYYTLPPDKLQDLETQITNKLFKLRMVK